MTFVITRTDWLTYLKAAKVMANLKPNYFPKSSSSSLSEEEGYNTNNDAERDATSGGVRRDRNCGFENAF